MINNKLIAVGLVINKDIKNGLSLLKQLNDIWDIDKIFVICCNNEVNNILNLSKVECIDNIENKNIIQVKNKLIQQFISYGSQYNFILEDNIIIKNSDIFQMYVKTAIIFNMKFLCFSNEKIKDINIQTINISINSGINKQFIYLHKDVFKYVGYLNEKLNEEEYLLDYYLRITNKDSAPLPFIFFPDIINSNQMLEIKNKNIQNNTNKEIIKKYYNFILDKREDLLQNYLKYKLFSYALSIQQKYTTAVCAIVKYQNNYLDEWIQYYTKLGFDHIFLYQNNDEIKLKQQYNNITIIDWPFQNCKQQMKAYNDCVNKFGYRFHFMAFFDADEFLYIKNGVSLQDLLREYSDCFGIAINWRVFGDNGLQKVQNNDYRVLPRFTKCSKNLREEVKIIVNCGLIRQVIALKSINFVSPHFIDKPVRDLDKNYLIGPKNNNITKQDYPAEIYHYICKTKQQFLTSKALRNRADIITDKKYEYEQYWKENCRNEIDNYNLVNFLDEENNK